MKNITILLALVLFCTALGATKYAGEIFQISPGVLNQAMGGTGLTWTESVSGGWWNPALLAAPGSKGVEIMHSEHFDGLLQQNQVALVLGDKARASLLINHLGINEIKLTQLENPADSLSNDNRPEVWKTVGNNDFILYGSLARSLGDRLHFGLTPKLAYRDLAGNTGFGFGADLGLLWNPGAGVSAAANLRDFFSTQIIWENGTHEVAIPNLDLELGYDLALLSRKVPLHLAVRSQIHAEDRGEAASFSAGIFSADLHAGLLVRPIPALKVMAGWDADAFTAGLGVRWNALGLDYAWRDGAPDALGASHKLALNYRW